MLVVKTTVKPSPIHGLGLHALEFIPKGATVSVVTPGFDLAWETLPASPIAEYLKHYGYQENGRWCLDGDNQRFVNASDDPNLMTSTGHLLVWAIRDIQPGEELTMRYDPADPRF